MSDKSFRSHRQGRHRRRVLRAAIGNVTPMSLIVKVFGCRHTMTAPRPPGPASANLQVRCYGAAAGILHPSLLIITDGAPPMQKCNDLNRSLNPLDPDGTLIAVIELSQSSWLVGGIVPGVEGRASDQTHRCRFRGRP